MFKISWFILLQIASGYFFHPSYILTKIKQNHPFFYVVVRGPSRPFENFALQTHYSNYTWRLTLYHNHWHWTEVKGQTTSLLKLKQPPPPSTHTPLATIDRWSQTVMAVFFVSIAYSSHFLHSSGFSHGISSCRHSNIWPFGTRSVGGVL